MSMHLIKRASSLIIASKYAAAASLPGYNHWKNSGCEDYAVTLLKRNSNSSFMPDAIVFPGGISHESDLDDAWLEHFRKCGVGSRQISKLFRQPDAHRTSTYQKFAKELKACSSAPAQEDLKDEPAMSPELSLRLTALRETFEETGLLLARPYVDGEAHPPLALTEQGTYHVLGNSPEKTQDLRLGGKTLEEWRASVNADASKFLELFTEATEKREMLLPWVDGLVEWWGWLTPSTYSTRRFDTIFYTALLPALEIVPGMLSPCNESSKLMVLPPSSAVKDFQSGGSWIAPPQLYEFGRMANFHSLEQLIAHVNQRTRSGDYGVTAPIVTWLPQLYTASDGYISVLPGDCLYHDEYKLNEDGSAPLMHCTMKELRGFTLSDLPRLAGSPQEAEAALRDARASTPMNRLEIYTHVSKHNFVVNVDLGSSQVTPVNIDFPTGNAVL